MSDVIVPDIYDGTARRWIVFLSGSGSGADSGSGAGSGSSSESGSDSGAVLIEYSGSPCPDCSGSGSISYSGSCCPKLSGSGLIDPDAWGSSGKALSDTNGLDMMDLDTTRGLATVDVLPAGAGFRTILGPCPCVCPI